MILRYSTAESLNVEHSTPVVKGTEFLDTEVVAIAGCTTTPFCVVRLRGFYLVLSNKHFVSLETSLEGDGHALRLLLPLGTLCLRMVTPPLHPIM